MADLHKTVKSDTVRTRAVTSAERESMFGEMPGRVVSFNMENQTATIQPLYRPRHNGQTVDMPELLEVPVRFPRAGSFVITSPVKAGDRVVLRPNFRSSEGYHTGGKYESGGEARSFSLSDMEAFLDGGEPLTEPITSFNPDNFEIRTEDGAHRIEITPDGSFRIKGSQGDWCSLIAQLARALADDGLDVKTGSSEGSNHALENRDVYSEIATKMEGMIINDD